MTPYPADVIIAKRLHSYTVFDNGYSSSTTGLIDYLTIIPTSIMHNFPNTFFNGALLTKFFYYYFSIRGLWYYLLIVDS